MEPKKITHLTFDFFGTLVGYTPGSFAGKSYRNSHNYLLSQGINIDYDIYQSLFSQVFTTLEAQSKITNEEFHMKEVGKQFFSTIYQILSPTIQDEFIELYITDWNKGIQHFPQIKKFLKKLKQTYHLSIISNTHYPTLVSRNLDTMGIADLFDHVVTSVEYGIRKPDPRIFQETLNKWSIDETQVMHIGDTYIDDYEVARNAGIQCILLDPTNKWNGKVALRAANLFEIDTLL